MLDAICPISYQSLRRRNAMRTGKANKLAFLLGDTFNKTKDDWYGEEDNPSLTKSHPGIKKENQSVDKQEQRLKT